MNNALPVQNENNDIVPVHVKQFREAIIKVRGEFENLPGALVGDSPEYLEVCKLKHTFVDKGYVRELFMPKGMYFITKIHKKRHPYFVMIGDVSVITENGVARIRAPHHGITEPGTIRFIYTHEDTIWVTVHSTEETDIAKIEEEIIAKDFMELDNIIEL